MTCQFDNEKIGTRYFIKSYVSCRCGYYNIYDKIWCTYKGHFIIEGMKAAFLLYDQPEKCAGCGREIIGGGELCDDGGMRELFTQKVDIENVRVVD